MTAGRTSWWAKDVAWLRRELVVELGEEFGPGGPLVLDQLNAEAREQRDGGRLKTGYRHLARQCFLTDAAEAQRIVRQAATLGALDDFEEGDDGRRFVARVSGFRADQQHAQAAQRQQAKRDRDRVTERDGALQAVTNHAVPPIERDESERSVTERDSGQAIHARTPAHEGAHESRTSKSTPTPTTSLRPDSAEAGALCDLLASLVVGNDPKAKPSPKSRGWRDAARLLLERDGRDYEEAKRVMRWCQADQFWRSNVLSMPTFREKYPKLLLKMGSGVRSAPLEQASKTGRDEWIAWAQKNVPDLPVSQVVGAVSTLSYAGQEVTPERVRARIGATS